MRFFERFCDDSNSRNFTTKTVLFLILLTIHLEIELADGSPPDVKDMCPSISPDVMNACPSTFSDHTYEMIKLIPKIVPLDHPDYDQLVPPQARGKLNLYCAHPACMPVPCLNGGTCAETLADFECNCTALYTGKRCEERVVINNVKMSGNASQKGVVTFLPRKTDSSWYIMSFSGWRQLTSDLVCKYLGFPGVYATVDGAVFEESVALEAKVTVCPEDAESITDCWITDDAPPPGTSIVGVICCEAYECTKPGNPLGLESGDVIDPQLTASSENPNFPYQANTARLRGSLCWQPMVSDKLQWLQVDLLAAHLLTGLSMQGRADLNYYVTSFILNYTLNGEVWTAYRDELNGIKYFPGNLDGSSVQTHTLYPGVVTQYVRIQPWTWIGYIALRLELFGVGPIAIWDGLMKSNCSFDIDLCGWRQATDDDSDWLHQGSRVSSHDLTPAGDHTTSYGAYVFITSNSSGSQTAKLRSPPVTVLEGHNSTCLRFWSHMNGERVGTLRVFVTYNESIVTSSEYMIFERRGSQGDLWILDEIEFIMDQDAPFYIIFEGSFSSLDNGSIALDDVTIISGHCPALSGSVDCDFDVDDCGWYQDDADDGDWMFISGSPPTTSSKGPHQDHSTKDGRYLYITGLHNTTHYTARLSSPILIANTTAAEMCFRFWYYALSGDDSELSVELVEEGSISTPVFTEVINITYDRVWRQSKITIPQPSQMSFSIVIEGRVKGHHVLAIDDTALYHGPCLSDASNESPATYIDGYQSMPVSCAAWKRLGQDSDGYYVIDPDGPGNGVQPFKVYCDMTTDPTTGIMVFTHDLSPESEVDDHEDPYSFPLIVTYDDASLTQIAAAADVSGECSQYIKFGCEEVVLSGYAAWYDRNGAQMNYWGGAPFNSSMCACGSAGTCFDSTLPCDCDEKAKYILTHDDGNITHKASLPVSEIRAGDTGSSYETAWITLGPLYCQGDDNKSIIANRTDFVMLTKSRMLGDIIEITDALNAQQCADACIAQDAIPCHSFSYAPSNGTCILKKDRYHFDSLVRDTSWNEYIRTGPPPEKSVDCTFSQGRCGWIQDSSDDADWIISDGSHGNKDRTGPLSDHTSGRNPSDLRSVRLMDGAWPSEGRVEVFYKNQWASVCGTTWSVPTANILCRTLGFGEAHSLSFNSNYTHGTGEVVVELQCNGDESDIRECPMRDIGEIACPHTDEAGVVCLPPVRLIGGVTPREGTVEVLFNGAWGSVCHKNWDITDAQVVCRSLGYGGALNAVGSAFYGKGSGQVLLDEVACTGNEDSIFDCGHSPIGNNSCIHDEDAGVVCSYIDNPAIYPRHGFYLFVDSSENTSPSNTTTRLRSPPILMPVGEGAVCFRFWYYMFGDEVDTLRVYVDALGHDAGSGDVGLEISGDQGDQWILGQFEIGGNATEPFTLTIEAITGQGDNGDIAIDDIEVLGGYCPYVPISCDFEDNFICGFVQDEHDDVDWIRGRGNVNQDNERPPYDHTFMDIYGSYMYLKSVDTTPGSTAHLWTPPYAFPGHHCLTFYYFMHGNYIGSLHVYAVESGANVSVSTPVWSRIGPQGYEWKKAVTPIVAESHFQIVFEAISGGNSYSNIAIDDVTLSNGPCEVPKQDHVTDKPGCKKVIGDRLGVEDGRIPDSAFTASSYNATDYEPYRARLNSYAPYVGWLPADADADSWLQVDFVVRRWVTGALTQGLQKSSQWSTLIRFSYLNDNNERLYVSENECDISAGRVYRANYDSDNIVTTIFPQPILSTNIRFHIDGSNMKDALRCEILGLLDIDCNDLYTNGYTTSGVYTLRPADGNQTMRAYCDMEMDEGGWTVFQRRRDGATSFSRPSTDYENGFGDLSSEYWLGLENLRRILCQRSYELRIDLEYTDGTRDVANYSSFSIGDQSTGYRLHIGGFQGHEDDPLAYHNGTSFKTPDQLPGNGMPSCQLPRPSGGWWYVDECDGRVNLNGVYPGTMTEASRDMFWNGTTTGTLRFSQMKIKPIS